MPIVTTAELAGILGVTPKAVADYGKRGCPMVRAKVGNAAAQWDTVAVIGWIRATAAQGQSESDIDQERLRKVRAEADILELQRGEREGSLLPAGHVAQVWGALASAAKARLRAIPAAITPRLLVLENYHEAEALLLEAIDDALTELAGGAESVAVDVYQRIDAATEADGLAVGEPDADAIPGG